MKEFVIIACAFVAVYGVSDEFKDKSLNKLSEIAEVCIPEVGATDDDISELMEKKTPSTKTGKCLIACFSKNLGLMKDGKPNKDSAIAAMQPLKADDPDVYDKFLKVLDKCQGEVASETEECELAVKYLECTRKEALSMGFDADNVMG